MIEIIIIIIYFLLAFIYCIYWGVKSRIAKNNGELGLNEELHQLFFMIFPVIVIGDVLFKIINKLETYFYNKLK